LAQDAHAVILPPVLIDSTIRGAALVAAGSSLAGVVSTSVATLTDGVMKAMLLAKLKFAFLGLVTLAIVSTSVGVVAQTGPGARLDRPSDDDRLKSVEQKLDKLLEVLAGSSHSTRPAGSTAMAPEPPTTPPIAAAAPMPPPAGSGMMRNMMPTGMGMAPGMGGMRGMGGMQGSIAGSFAGQPNLDTRVNRLEQRMGDLERRLVALEHRLTSATPNFGRRGYTGLPPGHGGSSLNRSSAAGPLNPANSSVSVDPFSDTRPAAENPGQTRGPSTDTRPAAETPGQPGAPTPSSDVVPPAAGPASGEGSTVNPPSACPEPN
jgi:hypothetical protein